MLFNSNRREKKIYPALIYTSANVQSTTSQKHLGLILDSKLDFNDHINKKINTFNKMIGLMK